MCFSTASLLSQTTPVRSEVCGGVSPTTTAGTSGYGGSSCYDGSSTCTYEDLDDILKISPSAATASSTSLPNVGTLFENGYPKRGGDCRSYSYGSVGDYSGDYSAGHTPPGRTPSYCEYSPPDVAMDSPASYETFVSRCRVPPPAYVDSELEYSSPAPHMRRVTPPSSLFVPANASTELYMHSHFPFVNYPQMTEEPISPSSAVLQNHSLQNSICKVCGDTASGNHFGVLSCEACKSFFRRSIRANARYACRGSRQCTIEKHTRNRCQYCRLQRCVAVGMRKEAVQEERTPSGAKLHRAGTPQPLGFPNLNFIPPAVPYLPRFDSPTSPVPRVLSQATRMYGSLPNLKMEFDRPSSSPYGSGTIHQSYASTPDATISNMDMTSPGNQISVSVLVNADMQSEGQGEEVKPTNHNIKLEDLFEGIRSSLMKVIEWAKRIPSFVSLSLDDQVKLLKAGWCEQCNLRLAARNGPKSDMFLLGNGVQCKKENIEDPEVRRVVVRITNEVAYWLDYMNVDRVELACLKGIILFNPDAKGLSPASRKKVEIYQEQILQALETRTKTMYPITPQRFSKLLLRLAPLKAISLEIMQHMEVQRALGNTKMDNLFGELLDFD